MSTIIHPLAFNVKVRADKPSCPCKGARIEQVEGVIAKVISNSSGYWYYLQGPNVTVKGEWITVVFP